MLREVRGTDSSYQAITLTTRGPVLRAGGDVDGAWRAVRATLPMAQHQSRATRSTPPLSRCNASRYHSVWMRATSRRRIHGSSRTMPGSHGAVRYRVNRSANCCGRALPGLPVPPIGQWPMPHKHSTMPVRRANRSRCSPPIACAANLSRHGGTALLPTHISTPPSRSRTLAAAPMSGRGRSWRWRNDASRYMSGDSAYLPDRGRYHPHRARRRARSSRAPRRSRRNSPA